MLDRREAFMQRFGIHDDNITSIRRRHGFGPSLDDVFDDAEDEEMARRLRERWRFDQDDDPAVGPEGADDQDRMLVDDYDPRYLRYMMTLLTDQDQQLINNDASLVLFQDGRAHSITPYRIAAAQSIGRRDPQGGQRGIANGVSPLSSTRQMSGSLPLPSVPNGTPISIQTQMKGMQPPSSIPPMRIPSAVGVRPPPSNLVPVLPPHQSASPQQSSAASPPTPASSVSPTIPPSTDGDPVKAPLPNGAPAVNGPSSNGSSQQPTEISAPPTTEAQPITGSPRQKVDVQQPITLPFNGYHGALINGYPIPNGTYIQTSRQHNGLSPQQMQNLKMAFAQSHDTTSAIQATAGRQIPAFGHPNGMHFNVQMGPGVNVNLKPPGRQWNGSPMQQVATLGNGQDVSGTTVLSSPHNSPGVLPARTPSANGNRAVTRPGSIGAVQTTAGHMVHGGQYPALSLSPRLQHTSPSPAAAVLPSHQTPPRPPPTPTMKMSSPSIQHQQPLSSSQGGY